VRVHSFSALLGYFKFVYLIGIVFINSSLMKHWGYFGSPFFFLKKNENGLKNETIDQSIDNIKNQSWPQGNDLPGWKLLRFCSCSLTIFLLEFSMLIYLWDSLLHYVPVNELYCRIPMSGFGGIHNLCLVLWINCVGLNLELCSIIYILLTMHFFLYGVFRECYSNNASNKNKMTPGRVLISCSP